MKSLILAVGSLFSQIVENIVNSNALHFTDIRPGMSKSSNKCDPVALYQYYKSQWSKRPLPGEDPRNDLRWAVRTRLAQQQQV